jgi:hypothetical protein
LYQTLRKFIREERLIQCHESGDDLDPLSLIDDVVGKHQFALDKKQNSGVVVHGKVEKIFYQGSAQSVSILEEQVNQEKVIRIGKNATISAPIIIADSIENSFNVLANSTVDDELKSLLNDLVNAINEVNKKAPSEEAEAMARDAEALVKEATSSKPRRKWYEISIEGLKQAAINIGEIAEPVLDIVKKLTSFLLI